MDIATRFWSKVQKRGPTKCWPWIGSTKPGGYGQFTVTTGNCRPAHVVAWELANKRPLPRGKYGLHRCDNPNCVNPAHVYPGTQAENIQKSVALKTHRNSRKTHCDAGHKLTEANIYRKPSKPWVRNCLTCIRLRKGT